jgi:hypothetical protein
LGCFGPWSGSVFINFGKKWLGLHFRVIFLQTRLVTLIPQLFCFDENANVIIFVATVDSTKEEKNFKKNF